MVSSVSGSSNVFSLMQHMQRPSASDVASTLFSALDTKNQGYIDLNELATAFDSLSTTSTTNSTASSSASASQVFSALDSDNDGKVTQDELTSSLQTLADQLDAQASSWLINNSSSSASSAPPPPPNDAGLSKDQLTETLANTSSSDTNATNLLSSVIANFDEADTNEDGKVSMQEALAYQQSQASESTTGSTSKNSATATPEEQVMQRIAQLVNAYSAGGANNFNASYSNAISIIA